jgi:hypothetical protein
MSRQLIQARSRKDCSPRLAGYLAGTLALLFVLGGTAVHADQTSAEPADANSNSTVTGSGSEASSDATPTDRDADATGRPLSVPPLDHAEYPEERPEWIDQTPDLDAEVVIWPVKSLLQPTPRAAEESLQLQVRGAVAAYAEHVLGEQRAEAMDFLPGFDGNLDELPAEDYYAGTATVGEEMVYEAAARLRFDEEHRQRLRTAWKEHEVATRLWTLGVAGGGGLCLLLAGTGLTRRFARRHAG